MKTPNTADKRRFNDLGREHLVPQHDGSMTTKRVGQYLYTCIHHKDGRRVIATRTDRIRGGYIVESTFSFSDDAGGAR